jgi:hypothetical protein
MYLQILRDRLHRSISERCLSEPHNVLEKQDEAREPYNFGDVFSLR